MQTTNEPEPRMDSDTAIVTIKDFCEVTDALGPNELQHLFHHLDLEERDIENATKGADTTDPRLQAIKVLSMWKKEVGRNATRGALLAAKNKASMKKRKRSDSEGIPQTSSEDNLEICQRELKHFYTTKMGKVNLLPWMPDVVEEMESIFVELELIKQQSFKSTEKVQKIERNEDLVTLKSNQGLQENRIIVLGDSGSGKSTMAANIAYKWAKQDHMSSLSRFSLLFLIGIHDVENKDASLLDLIFNQILPKDTKVLKEGLRSYMSQHAEEILLVVDGMDEDSFGLLQNQSSTLTKVLHNKELRKCCVILSTRPHKIGELGEHLAYYTQVRLKGFSDNNIDRYVQRYFRQDQEKIDQLVAKLNAESHIKAMASIPVLLLMICLLFEDEGTLPNTKSKLYQATINHLWKRYTSKEGQAQTDDTSDDDEFDDELWDLINTLGEAVGNSIEQHDGKVLFNEQELGAKAFDLGCRVGIISRERLRSKLKSKTLVTFLHTSFQDFCAGVYLANLNPNDAKFQNILRKLDHWSEDNDIFLCSPILEFCCGIKPILPRVHILPHMLNICRINLACCCRIKPNLSKVHAILQQMLSMQDEKGTDDITDITFHLSHIYESQLPYDEYLKLVPLYSSANNVKMAISHQTVPHVLYLLKMSESPATEHSGLFSKLDNLNIDTSSIIPHLPSIVKYTTNLGELQMVTDDSSMKTADLTNTYRAIDTLPKLTKLLLDNDSDISLDATDLLHMLTRNKPNKFELLALGGYQFDVTAMAEFLVHSKSTLSCLILCGTSDATDQPTVDIDVVIKVLPDLNELGTLGLSGYNVSGAVEHLKPIVPQLDRLTLQNFALQEKHLLHLFSFLHTAQKLTALDLSYNDFSVSSVTSLVGCLNEMPHLKELDLYSTGLNDESACILAQGLKDKPALSTLDLEINPGILTRGQDALKSLPCSVSVQLDEMDTDDIKDITLLLSHIYERRLPYDEYLKLVPLYSSANNVKMEISHQSVPHVLYLLKMSESSATEHSGLFSKMDNLNINTSSIIPQLPSILKYTTNLDDFDMCTNDSSMKTADLTDTYRAIDTLPKLTKLWLENNSDISLDATDLLYMLTRNKPNKFEHFVLCGYQFDASAMAEFLVHSKSSLSHLQLYGQLDTSGQPTACIDVVIKVLPDLNKLDTLHLTNYNVSGAVEYLRPTVPQLDGLTVKNCALQEKHLLHLFSFLLTAQELTDVDLSCNAFSVSSVTSLVGCLNEIPLLEELSLCSTGLNDESACILAQGLKDKSTLSELVLSENPGIGQRGRDALKGLPCVLLI